MFVIVTYDVNAKRVNKVLKICRKYLIHAQKSVFEGMITQSKLEKLKKELHKTIDTHCDKICIYEIDSLKYTSKEQIGVVEISDNII